MKRSVTAVFFLLTAGFLFGEGPEITAHFTSFLSETTAFPQPAEGSEDEERLISWLKETFDTMDLPCSTTDFSEARYAHSFSSILSVDIPGQIEDTLIVAVPLNTPAGDGGLTGIASAVAAVHFFSDRENPLSLRFLFLGGENSTGQSFPLGTEYYLQEFYPDYPVILLYLDIHGIPSGLSLETGSNRITSPRRLVETCSSALRATHLGAAYSLTDTLISRLGVKDEQSVIHPYLEAGYPSILLRQKGNSDEAGTWISGFVSLIEAVADTYDRGVPTDWDRHYLFFRLEDRDIVIGETAYVIGLIVLLCGVLLYPLIFTRRFKRYIKTLGHNGLMLPLLLISVYLFLLLGTLLAQVIPGVKDFPDLWTHAPFLFFALKSTGALLLFMILFRLVRHIPFPRNSSFYSASAVLLLLIDILILMSLELSLAFYVAWAFFFCFLFTILPNRYLKIAAFLLSLFWFLLVLYDIFNLPALRVCRTLLYSHIRGNLLLAFMLLPFLFMLIRIDLLFAHRKSQRRHIISLGFLFLLLGAFSYLTVTLLRFDPYQGSLNQPVLMEQNLSETNHTARLTSPAPIGNLNARELNLILPGGSTETFLTTDIEVDTFLDRMNISLRIRSRGNPEHIELVLHSEEKIVVYDATFPYRVDPDTGAARFFIGRNPPEDLVFNLTLPSVVAGYFDIVLRYSPTPLRVTPTERTFTLNRSLTIEQTVPLVIDTPSSME